MAYKILLNDSEFHFGENGLPCLVHYKEKQGGSQFTVTLVADLFLQGSKILFLTAYPYAKDNFFEQTKGMESKIFFVENKEMLAEAQNYQAIILKSGDGDLYMEALKTIPDLSERVVLVKNFEVFDQNILDSSVGLEKIILSGDIDKSIAKKQISDKFYKTTITFSEPETALPFETPALDKYVGYLKTADKEGLVKLEM
jgi:hypothetical protein